MVVNRDATHARVDVTDLSHPGSIAKIEVVIWGIVRDDLKFKPFQRIQVVTDAIRDALDESKIAFYASDSQPNRLQTIEIGDVKQYSRTEESRVQQFLAWKVYWMGFKRGDKRTKVWIADPWDANYLGVTPQDLVRVAQTLEAHELITLVSKDVDFASSSDALLRAATPQESSDRVVQVPCGPPLQSS